MSKEIQIGEHQAVEALYGDVCQIIDGARNRIATYLNTEVCMTNWYMANASRKMYYTTSAPNMGNKS